MAFSKEKCEKEEKKDKKKCDKIEEGNKYLVIGVLPNGVDPAKAKYSQLISEIEAKIGKIKDAKITLELVSEEAKGELSGKKSQPTDGILASLAGAYADGSLFVGLGLFLAGAIVGVLVSPFFSRGAKEEKLRK